MAYFDADMDVQQMSTVDRMDTEYTIYVNSLPVELNEDAIRDIFGQYGKITGMFHPHIATWAYITYGTYREAEFAIRELNNKKPLYLKVALAKERSTKEEQKSNVSEAFERPIVVNATADSPSIHRDINYQSIGRGQSITAFRKQVIPQMTMPYRYVDQGSLPPVSPHDVEDPYANTNKLWTRGVITVTPDGKRHVSLGRGYTLYEYPEPYPKIEECISKIYEQRNNGLYEYSEDKLKNGVQSCSVCSTKTIKHCEKCHTYYCSKACQLEDWPQHQAQCERIPALVESLIDMSSLQINQDQTRKTSNTNNKTAKFNDVKLRRPNTINAVQVENSSNMSANMPKSNTDVTYSKNNDTQDRHLSGQHDNDIDISQTKMTDQPVVNATNNSSNASQQHRLRKFNGINESYSNTNSIQSRKNNGCSISSSTNQSHNRSYQSDSNRDNFNKEKRNDSNVRDRTYNNDKDHSFRKNGFQSDKSFAHRTNSKENVNTRGTSTSYNTSPCNSVNNDLSFYKDTHLSKTKFITVEVIIPLDNGEYWINKVEDIEPRKNLMIKLQDVAKNSHAIVQPIIGEVYGVLYETIWHRAMVISLNPVKVNFIDFGNDEILKKDDEIKDIKDLVKAPKFARKIRLTQGTSDKYRNLQQNEIISVRMLSIDSDKTIIVEVQEQSESLSSHIRENASNNKIEKLILQENKISNESTKVSTVQIPNILDALVDLLTQKATSELQIEGVIQICESAQKNVYSATLSPHVYNPEIEMIFNDMPEECSKIQTVYKCADYKPKAEELVCGKCSDGWYRGYVSVHPETSSKLSIISIDEAKSQTVETILPCPKRYLNICALGVMCEINPSVIELQVGHVYEFTATINKSQKQEMKIKIIVGSEMVPAVVRPWKSVTNSLTPLPELKNGSKICLTSYRNHYCMFARSLDEEQIEYYNTVMQSVARYAQTAPHLTKPPVNQQIVIAPFEDGNSYRAMVYKTENGKAKIIYIDFGNVDEVDIKDLKVMPQSHSLQQSCAAKLMLKDVPRDVPSNQEVDLYIRNLLGKEVPLVCTYEGTSPKDGVRLTMLTGECVNDTINQLLTPGWKNKNNDDNTCYMFSDIKIASLGRVGDTVDALLLYIREDNRTMYMMSPFDTELITHIFDVMPAMLTEYCEKTEYYIPRALELCLALYDGAWYRATCFNPKDSHTTSQIYFIDYGNIESVEHKNIRLMPKDFVVPAALANMCTVVNLAPVNGNGNYSKAIQNKIEELVQPNTTIKIKIVECCENGDYKIELPEVRDALIKHGLV